MNQSQERTTPIVTLVSIGLGLGLLLTGLAWLFPSSAKYLTGAPWLAALLLLGTVLILAGSLLVEQEHYPTVPRPALYLAVMAATALVYLFPELFAPGCGNMPRAFAACPAACRITTCTDWDAPGENGCNAKPPNKGCCWAYETTCDPGCSEPDPDPTPPPASPPSISGTVNCTLVGSNGWCRSGATLNLSASDPQGYATTITGDMAGAAFSCAGPTCAQNLPVGSGAIHFQASAPASGLSSAVGSAAFAYDPVAPTAALVISGSLGQAGWYTSASASTTGADTTSGLAFTQVSVDGGGWQSSATLTDGIHAMTGRAVDRAGNTTATASQTVQVDGTAPSLSVDVAGTLSAGWYTTNVILSASASDATSGLAGSEYRIDGGTWTAGDNLQISSDGLYNLDFRARDNAGNTTVQTLGIQRDATPPLASIPLAPDGQNGWYVTHPTITLAASDVTSGLASAAFDTGGNSITLPDGTHTLVATAVDNAGNTTTLSQVVLVDTTPPALAPAVSASKGQSGWLTSGAEIAANASDPAGGSGLALVEYRVDGGTWQVGSTASVLTDGSHTVEFRATDVTGNQAASSRAFKIDQTSPVSAFSNPPESSTTTVDGLAAFSGSSSDVLSGLATVEYSLDAGATWRDLDASGGKWSFSWDTTTLPNGLYTILVRAVDYAGNQENTARVQVTTANRPPLVALQSAWAVQDAGSLSVREMASPLGETTLRITCNPYHPDVKLSFDGENIPGEIRWDRLCGDGAYAADSGSYPVTVTVCDVIGRCTTASGLIKVPLFSLPPTATATTEPTAVRTPRAVPTATQRPAPVVTAPPGPSEPEPAPLVVIPPTAPLWTIAGLLGLMLALAASSLADPRPQALGRLGQSASQIIQSGKTQS